MRFKNTLLILGVVNVSLVAETDTTRRVEIAEQDSVSFSISEARDTTADNSAEDVTVEEGVPSGISVQEIPVDTVLDESLVVPDTAEKDESIRQLRSSMTQPAEDTVSLSDGTVLVGKVLATDADGVVFLDNRTGREMVVAFERVRSITIGESSSTVPRKDTAVSETASEQESESEVVFEAETEEAAREDEDTSEGERGPGRVVPRLQFALGPRLNFFHYDEKFPEEDIRETFGDVIIGEPKSTEYGPNFGFGFEGLVTGYDVPLQFRFGIRMDFGLINVYDGSTQGMPIISDGDTVGAEFQAVDFKKSNYFFGGNVGLGWCGQFSERLAVTIRSGLDARLWIRDLIELGSDAPISFFEYYYWLNVPVIIESYIRSSSSFTFGLMSGVNFMVRGKMKVSVSSSYLDDDIEFPPVVLGNIRGVTVGPIFLITPSSLVRIRIAPSVEFFGFGKSNTETATAENSYGESEILGEFYEPASRTVWGGLDVSVVFTP